MDVYVASSFKNQAEVKEVMSQLVSLGHRITFDWTGEDASGLKGSELTRYLTECAMSDMNGVNSADAVIVINHPEMRGALVEMGMAIASGKPIFLVYHNRVSNIFDSLPGVEKCSSIRNAVHSLDKYSKHEMKISGRNSKMSCHKSEQEKRDERIDLLAQTLLAGRFYKGGTSSVGEYDEEESKWAVDSASKAVDLLKAYRDAHGY